ncbi:penicillin-binding transpeptidase domain-containing protein [Nonomuraea antimicrobica]
MQRDTGEILAVGTKNLHQERDALAGKFPAGTAFSIVAADALLKKGVSPKQRLACPQERTVGGAKFVQVGQAAGVTTSASFQENFAKGCVTALASLARRVTADDLIKSAQAFGVGQPWRLPLKSFSGSRLKLDSDADKAKAIAGQNVQVSPLGMALVAAAVASGTWRPPVLVTNPKAPDPAAEPTPAIQPAPVPVDPEVRATLQTMMRAGAASTPAQGARAGSTASRPRRQISRPGSSAGRAMWPSRCWRRTTTPEPWRATSSRPSVTHREKVVTRSNHPSLVRRLTE